MNTFLVLTFLFFVGCTLGWCLELVYRRIVHKKWINPGFLTGPYLPLYGTGLIFLYGLSSIDYSFITSIFWRDIFVIAIIAVLMTLIEFITGLIFIKGMKVKLWDYSDRKANVMGIICPLFSFFWAVIGAAYYLFIHSLISNMVGWFNQNIAYSFVVGMFFGIFLLDCIYSFKLVAKIKKFAKQNNIVVVYEMLKLSIASKAHELKRKAHFVFAFRSLDGIENELKKYFEREKMG